MRRPLVAGNWKMNGSRAMAADLAAGVAGEVVHGVDVLLCPPAVYIDTVAAAVRGRAVLVGAQDCSEHEAGAYTGETAAAMLQDCGCTHVIVGHSERRQFFGDSDDRVAAKARRAHVAGLVPIFCVGETLEERRAGITAEVVERQLAALLGLAEIEHILRDLVIAYEPVWAIGTGETATPEQAQSVHATIRARLAQVAPGSAADLRILYGGSVKADNARALFAMPDIDGGLIGGASLDAAAFLAICRAAAR
jgi:triosephosphate isomerase (TIM)